jgi:ATP-dependent metalloprotease FtsH
MFTSDAQTVIDRAKDIAVSNRVNQLRLDAIVASLVMDRRGVQLLAQCLDDEAVELQRKFKPTEPLRRSSWKLPLAEEVRAMLALAKALVSKFPSANLPPLISLPHLTGATALSLKPEHGPFVHAPKQEKVEELVRGWVEEGGRPPGLGDLTQRLRAFRQEVLNRLYGQDQAVHDFVEGLFNVEVVGATDMTRQKPAGLFVFAGPPGVGKTYLAELGADHLDRPFKRFDMSAFANGPEVAALIGVPHFYQGSQPGTLTGFIRQNPNAVLLFDEIEKTHYAAIHLFLQILDAGRLQDKYTEQEVTFRDTILIFTTNAGRTLYENQSAAGVQQANSAFHRGTILDALRSETDPHTGTLLFPAAICSRLATGYPILFNHLGADNLARIADAELARVSGLLERQHGQHYAIAEEIPLALVMREGAQTDARTIKAQAEVFLKEEVFKACQLFTDERVDAALGGIEEVSVEIDEQHAGETAGRLFRNDQKPIVLFAGDAILGRFFADVIPQVDWCGTCTGEQVCDVLTKRDVDFVLLDLAVESQPPVPYSDRNNAVHDMSVPVGVGKTILHFDYSPPAARKFAEGQQILEQLHTRLPDIPVFLFSLEGEGGNSLGKGVDEELVLACARAGGARGAIRTSLGNRGLADWETHRDALYSEIERTTKRLRVERTAADLARQNQVVTFDTAPAISEDGKHLQIRCRNFRVVRSVRSADASGLLSEVERPTTRLDDVIGAAAAKEALTFIRDWLQDPKKYAAAGVEPPRGCLLTGPPGTGKTMLARALAGECNCAFLVEAATSFVTKYQGSGPENVRNLFARARRYAPSVVFIDEIDAIGASRAEARAGLAGHGEALTLNQLLTEMDGFSKAGSRPVIVLAAANYPEKLDSALTRRFSRVVEVELPTRAEREAYLRKRLEARARHEVSAQMIERIAGQSQGMSVADLERIIAQAAVMSLANQGAISDAVLSEAFERVAMGEAKEGADPLRTARHEAGHALIMCELGSPPIYVTIVGRGFFSGYAAIEDREERRSKTKRELEDFLCQLLGGREAERLYYPDREGYSTGPANDLERATNLAEAMVHEFGMSDEIGLVRIDRRRPLSGELAQRCHAAVCGIIEGQSTRAQQILTRRRKALDRIVDALMEHSRLLKHELLELTAGHDEENVLTKEST